MLPNAEDSLMSLAGYIGKEMVPRIDDAYTASMTALISGLLLMLAHEQEHGANNYVQENAGIRELFGRWADNVGDADLSCRLHAAAGESEDDFRLSSLRQVNDRLREGLIAMHAHVEQVEDAWAREADEEIWQLLQASRKRETIEHVLDLFNSPG